MLRKWVELAFFIPGIMDIDDIQTLAGLNILGSVARKTAVYNTDLKVLVPVNGVV